MNARRLNSKRLAQGWTLLESVVVVMLVGFMAVGLWKTLQLIERNRGGESARELVERAQHALQGRLMRDHVLPTPDDAVQVSGRPNHLEGWLPVDVLGTEPPRRIRYLVDQALVATPSPLYQSDPMQLLDPPLAPRGSANGLDACMQLIQRETANVSASGNLRVAFGVQTRSPAGRAGAALEEFVLASPLSGAQGAWDQLRTRAVGYSELVHSLGCFQAYARLATEVKAAVLAQDLKSQADLNLELHDLLVRSTRESIINATWRIVNASVRLAISTWNTARGLVISSTTPMGLVQSTQALIGFALEAALWSALLEFSADSLETNKAALPGAVAARNAAAAYAQELADQLTWHLGRANGFQQRGVMP